MALLSCNAFAAPKPADIQHDAEEAVRLLIRQDELQVYQQIRPLTSAEQKELASLPDQIQASRDKYPDSKSTDELRAKVRDAMQRRETLRKTAEEPYPDPSRLLNDFPDQPQRTAALIILRDELFSNNGKSPDGKVLAYNLAINRVEHEERQGGVTLDSGGLTKEQRRLIYSASGNPDAKPFRRKLFATYMPGLPNSLSAEDRQVKDDESRIFFSLRIIAALVVTLFCALLTPLMIIRLQYRETPPADLSGAKTANDLLTLPQCLRTVVLQRLRYGVVWTTGVVFDEKTWSETRVEFTTTGGDVHVSAGPALGAPGHISTHVNVDPVKVHAKSTTTRMDQLWMVTADNQQVPLVFTGGTFPTARGQVISILTHENASNLEYPLLAYNHSARKLDTFGFSRLKVVHELKSFLAWFGTVCVASLGGIVMLKFAFVKIRPASLGNIVVLALILASVWTVIVKGIYGWRRNSRFRKEYLPAYNGFFERATSELLKKFGVPQ